MSMTDAARRLGVSTSLISMVLNDRWRENRISPSTRDQVIKQLESINFRPNRLARSLHNHRTGAIGVLIPRVGGEFYQSILSGIESAIGNDFLPILGISEHDPEKERRLIVSFLEHRVDGLILVLTGEEEIDPLLREIRQKRIPLVLLDREHAGLSACFVGSNHRKIGEMAGEHLVQAGYRRCAFMSHFHLNEPPSAVVTQRQAGFEAVLRWHRVEYNVIQERIAGDPPDFQAAGERFVSKALAHQESPVGLFAMHPMAAAGVLLSCRRRGISVPEEVGVLTVDGILFNDLMAVSMSTIHQSTRRIGQMGAIMLRDMIEGRARPEASQRVELDVELSAAASTALKEPED